MNKLLALITILMLTAVPGFVLAHHGTASQFDSSKIISISGVISDVAYVNPHSYVYVDVADEHGNVSNWSCELRSSSVMNRSGWKREMFSPGTKVDIVGVASRKEATGCYVETIAFNGGPALERYAQITENKLQPQLDRPTKTPWGVPYIGGDWAAEQKLVGPISGPNAATGKGGGSDGRSRSNIPLTIAGQTAMAKATRDGDNVTGRLDCNPRDFFKDWTFDQLPNGIYQEKDKILMKYGFMGTKRVIHLNMKKHPEKIKPSWAGHSIGYWEGDVLVVDTIGFTEHVAPHRARSNQFRTTERFRLDSKRGALIRSYEGIDPLYWSEKQTGEDIVYLSDFPYQPYNCDDRTVE